MNLNNFGGFFYLASPYTRYPGGLDSAFELACVNAAVLIKAGVPTYSPIAHTHPIAVHGSIDPIAHEFWMACDAPMIDAARGLIVLQAEGWQQSEGMRIERGAFAAARKPIILMQPGVLPEEFELVDF